MKRSPVQNRRAFLKRGAALGASLFAAPLILKAETLGLNGRVGPNSRINIGFVGHGKQIGSHIGIVGNELAHPLYLCDLKPDKLKAAKEDMTERGYPDAVATPHYEDLTSDPAVDAIFVGKERAYNRRFQQMCSHYLVDPVA